MMQLIAWKTVMSIPAGNLLLNTDRGEGVYRRPILILFVMY